MTQRDEQLRAPWLETPLTVAIEHALIWLGDPQHRAHVRAHDVRLLVEAAQRSREIARQPASEGWRKCECGGERFPLYQAARCNRCLSDVQIMPEPTIAAAATADVLMAAAGLAQWVGVMLDGKLTPDEADRAVVSNALGNYYAALDATRAAGDKGIIEAEKRRAEQIRQAALYAELLRVKIEGAWRGEVDGPRYITLGVSDAEVLRALLVGDR